MMKAIVRYRDDQDLENVIDFVQKKVKVLYTHTKKNGFYSGSSWVLCICYIAPLNGSLVRTNLSAI